MDQAIPTYILLQQRCVWVTWELYRLGGPPAPCPSNALHATVRLSEDAFVYPSCGCVVAMPTYWLFCMRRLCKASSRTIVMHCWEKFDYFCNSFAIFAMSSKWWHSSHHWLWTARAHHWLISAFEITWVALTRATVGWSRWKARGLFNCYSSHLMHVDGWRKERYYFSKVFRPGSVDSQPRCKRALQAYFYSSGYCHMAFERIPILTCLSMLFYVSFRLPTVAFSSTCYNGHSYLGARL